MSNQGFKKRMPVVGMSLLLLGLPVIAAACDPVIPSVEDLIADTDIAVVKGRFFPAPMTGQPERAVFIITQVFRGNVGPGEYDVVEGGVQVQGVEGLPDARCRRVRRQDEECIIFVSKVGKRSELVVPIAWRYGLNETKGQVALEGCRISSADFEAALIPGPTQQAPLCPKRPVE